ncbi:hypothetical protein Tco_1185742, partial [Tanacetum coccineum]
YRLYGEWEKDDECNPTVLSSKQMGKIRPQPTSSFTQFRITFSQNCKRLLRERRLTEDEISATYKIMRRIEAEEMSLDVSDVVISSTRQDIDERWWC